MSELLLNLCMVLLLQGCVSIYEISKDLEEDATPAPMAVANVVKLEAKAKTYPPTDHVDIILEYPQDRRYVKIALIEGRAIINFDTSGPLILPSYADIINVMCEKARGLGADALLVTTESAKGYYLWGVAIRYLEE